MPKLWRHSATLAQPTAGLFYSRSAVEFDLDLLESEETELEVGLLDRRLNVLMPRVCDDVPASVAVEEIDAGRLFVVSSDGYCREVAYLVSAYYVPRLSGRL